MSIRHQLLLIALTTLILPWAGCQYARELESARRLAQEQALEASAATIAQALSAMPARVLRDLPDTHGFEPAQGDLYVYELHVDPLLDGYRDDWDLAADPTDLPGVGDYHARLWVGASARYLYLFLEVDDPRFVPEPATPRLDEDRFTRVDLALESPEGLLRTYILATAAPGPIEARRRDVFGDGDARLVPEPRIQGFWLLSSAGYRLELRVPRDLVAHHLWIDARSGSDRRAHAGFRPAEPFQGGRLFMATAGLDELLLTFIDTGTRVTVVDTDGLKIAAGGSVQGADSVDTSAAPWYRRLITPDVQRWPSQVQRPDRVEGRAVRRALDGMSAAEWLRSPAGTEPLLVAASPLRVDGEVRGAVMLEQAGSPLLELRDRALEHLFRFTVLATAVAVAIAFAVALSIGATIRRLRDAADGALGPQGEIRLSMPESGRRDEIGDLARAFERLLARLNDHAQYLRSLGGKLSHELRTPLTIVRSSIDNLESECVVPAQQTYLARAREGVARLQFILSALGAAARVEESIKLAERVPFDLGELLSSAIEGYRDAFPGAHIALEKPEGACPARGAPDLILQLLDKLMENAVDFCPPAGRIMVRLERAGAEYRLSVENEGPAIPAEVRDRLFESLFEHRPGHDEKPHFGLGLYIVRLIAEFHGGRASAANRADGGGVVFTICLPFL